TSAFPIVGVTVAVPPEVQTGDVHVTENGLPVQVINAKPLVTAGGNIQIVLAIDTSDSVKGAPLATAVQAATAFVEQLPPGIQVGLLTFSDQAVGVAPPSTDPGPILAAPPGTTTTRFRPKLYDGLVPAFKVFAGMSQSA